MKPSFPLCSAIALLCLTLPLGACDKPSEDAAQTAVEEETVAATEQALPAAAAPEVGAESVAAGSSMSDTSPAGEGVTAEEIPHSDVPPPSREVFTYAECAFEDWVGKAVDENAVKEQGRPYRILTPDSMMTMDHNPERINVVHDPDGKVTRVWCG